MQNRFDITFLRQTGLMIVGVSLLNLFNLLYHFFMVRSLPPVDYGHLNSLLALFMVISVPSGTVQTTVMKFISSYQVQNQQDRTRGLLRHLLFGISMVAFAMFLLIALSSPLISSFLQISSNGSIILFGVGLLFAMVIPVPWGGLQGLQRFGSLALNLILNGGIKLGSGILFVLFGLGVSGALGAIALSYFLTTLLSVFMLGTYLPKEKIEPSHRPNLQRYDWSYFSEVYPYFLPVGVTLLCFMVLTNIDLILVKHFFTPMEAGYYSIAQMVGKIILFLPVPVVMVMFPKLSSLLGQEKKALLILRQSLMIAVFLCGIALTLGLLFPALIIKILTGKIYEECIPLIRFFCLNMTFFSLAFILLYYHLSTQTRSFLYPLVFFTLTQIGLILFFHRSLSQVLWVVAIVGFCLLGTNLFLIYQAHLNRR